MFMTVVSIPLRAEIVNLYSAIKSAILLLPLMAGTAFGSAAGGAISSKKNLTFYTLIVASAFMMVGSGLFTTIPSGFEPAAKQWGFEALLGLGVGMNLSTSTLMTSLQARFEDHGKPTQYSGASFLIGAMLTATLYTAIAQGLVAQIRVFGGSIGVAVSFIVLNTRTQQTLGNILSPEQLDDFYKSPAAASSFQLAQQIQVRQTYIDAFDIDMRICLGIAATSLLVSLCTYQRNPPTMKKRLEDLERILQRSESQPALADV